MCIRGEDAEPVTLTVEDGRALLTLDDGEVLSFDADELRAELDIAATADESERHAA